MKAPELLPCPFCGGEAHIDGTSWTTRDGKDQAWATCKKCGTYGPSSPDAIAAWNRRAAPETLAASPEVAALVAEAVARDGKAMSASDFDCLVLDALAEAMKAMRKFPQPNYVISKVAEEAGEVVKAAIHCAEGRETAENLRGEMKQLIAMLYRLWVEGDQVHGLPPVAAAIRSGE